MMTVRVVLKFGGAFGVKTSDFHHLESPENASVNDWMAFPNKLNLEDIIEV